MMERALKERIIGAAVLVLVVVLVVPGIPGRSARVRAKSLVSVCRFRVSQSRRPGRSSWIAIAQNRFPRINLRKRRRNPSHWSRNPIPSRSWSKPRRHQSPWPKNPRLSNNLLRRRHRPGMWAVQLGSFGNQENAERLAAELRKQGHAAFLSQVMTSDGQRHRVRIGPQKDRAAAEAVCREPQESRPRCKVLPHP